MCVTFSFLALVPTRLCPHAPISLYQIALGPGKSMIYTCLTNFISLLKYSVTYKRYLYHSSRFQSLIVILLVLKAKFCCCFFLWRSYMGNGLSRNFLSDLRWWFTEHLRFWEFWCTIQQHSQDCFLKTILSLVLGSFKVLHSPLHWMK